MAEPEVVVTERRGSRFVAPGFVAAACIASVARVLVAGSPSTSTTVACVLIGLLGVACLAYCAWLGRVGRSSIVATPTEIRWVSGSLDPARIERTQGGELILHITPTVSSRRGGQQYSWEIVTPDGGQRIVLDHFDHVAVADACRRTGWTVTEGAIGRIPRPDAPNPRRRPRSDV